MISHRFFYLQLFFLLSVLFACKTAGRIHHIETNQYPLNKPGFKQEDSSLVKFISPYKYAVDSAMDVFLVTSETNMEGKTPEGLLGNCIADITIEGARKKYVSSPIDFCFLNNGGLRAPLPKGAVTRRNIFELMPFENEMMVMKISGSITYRLLNFIAAKGGLPVSGLTMKIKNNTAKDIFINGVPFDSTKTYCVVSSDYLINGGDNLFFLSEAISKEAVGIKLRDAIIYALIEKNKQGKTLNAKIEGRITLE